MLVYPSGCFCPSGLLRDGNRCVTREMCPEKATTKTPEEECSAMGMVYSDCGSACPATCDNPNPFCIFQCKQGTSDPPVSLNCADLQLPFKLSYNKNYIG